MIKLHKNNLLLRGIAMLLSAVLIVGMTANVAPMYVLAQEDVEKEDEVKPSAEADAESTSEEKAAVSITFSVYGYDADTFGTLELTNENRTMSCTTKMEDKDDHTEITLSGTVNEFLMQGDDSRWMTHVYVYRNQAEIADYIVYKGEDQTFDPRSFYAVTFVNDGNKYAVAYALDGKVEAIKPSDPVLEGCLFEGWVTQEGGDEAFDFTQEIAGPKTVYAKWMAKIARMSARSTANINSDTYGRIWLNGTPVVVTAGADDSKTKLYYDENRNGQVDAGENPIELPNETGSLEEGYDLRESNIYGAAMSGDYTGDIKITMTGGNVKVIQAGYTASLYGNFDFHMTGGTVWEVRSAGSANMTGNVNMVIGGSAIVSQAVYGGAENPNVTIDGNINIVVDGNARIGSGGSDGVYIGGQQPGNVITGASAITVKGGNINGRIYADQFTTTFRQKVTIDIQGGSISGAVQGISSANSQAPAVELRFTGGTVQGNVFGAVQAYVEDIRLVVDGGTIAGQFVGAFADKAGKVSIDIGSGSVGTLVMGKADRNDSTEKSWTKGTISIHGGTINGMVALRNGNVAASTEASEILLEGSPVFGGGGKILLRAGEAVTQTGEVTGSGIRIDVSNINQEGTLVVRPANSSIILNHEVFAVVGTSYGLINGSTSETSGNLYLGSAGAHVHKWEKTWSYDETSHWHNCSAADCTITENAEKYGYGPHTEDAGTVTTAPTQDTEGVRTYKCSVCGHERTETIPAAGTGGNQDGDNSAGGGGSVSDGGSSTENVNGNGTQTGAYNPANAETRIKSEDQGFLRKEVHIKAEETFDTIIATPLMELADILLSEAEKQLTAGGVGIRLILDVKDAEDNVSNEDRTIAEMTLTKSLPDFTLGQYLDVSLYKLVGTERTDITETSDKIIVTIAVPERLRNADDSKRRVFAIIRIHNGKADILNDIDDDEDTISIATDRFSTYAIIYEDGVKTNAATTRTKDNEPKTQDNTPIELYATLAMISGLSYLLLYFTERRHGMSEEIKKELISRLIVWAKKGSRMRSLLALAAIFMLLVYYHSIGKQITVEWKEVYGE